MDGDGNIIESKGYKPEEVYLYAILPRKALAGNEKAVEILRSVWTKVLEKNPLKEGFGRVVKIKDTTLDDLIKAFKSGDKGRVEEIIRELKNSKGEYEFGRGKGIFRVKDIHSDSVEGVMDELRIPSSSDGRVIIELKTSENPKIFTPEGHYMIVEDRWHWPYTGTGFISTKNGEILPEYYFSSLMGETEDTKIAILGIKLKTANGEVLELGW